MFTVSKFFFTFCKIQVYTNITVLSFCLFWVGAGGVVTVTLWYEYHKSDTFITAFATYRRHLLDYFYKRNVKSQTLLCEALNLRVNPCSGGSCHLSVREEALQAATNAVVSAQYWQIRPSRETRSHSTARNNDTSRMPCVNCRPRCGMLPLSSQLLTRLCHSIDSRWPLSWHSITASTFRRVGGSKTVHDFVLFTYATSWVWSPLCKCSRITSTRK